MTGTTESPAEPPDHQDRGDRPAPSDRTRDQTHFGEEGGLLTYGEYLRLPQLLAQQVPQTDPPARDELLFITIHQVYELWFAELLHELEAIRDAMETNEIWLARHLFNRVHAIERLLVAQIEILETMTPQDFLAFRENLSPASGFQSVQFRELEFLSGAKDPGFVRRFRGLTPDESARLSRRLAEPSLWDTYVGLLAKHGLDTTSEKELRRSLVTVATRRATYDDLWQLAEDLLTHDEMAALWRQRHVQMVERQIGVKSGTGGSSGSAYLRSRLDLKYYPALWELRSAL